MIFSGKEILNRPREKYLKIGVPLYEASIRCDWVAAKAILDKNSEIELVRYSITENGETALHVAASAKSSKHAEEFVKNLVGLMKKEDLALENENCNTALYLAAVAGNIETIKIMVKENRTLLTVPGAGGKMMPLYAAALFGCYDVVKYLYENSNELCDVGWTDQNRGWLLEKCVENDMFDVALEIVKKYPKLGSGTVLRGGFFAFIGSKLGAHEKENKALPLLRIIWEDIAKKPKIEIDKILRGPPDSIKQDKLASGRVVQAIQLQKLISEHLDKFEVETQNIIKGQPESTTQDTNTPSAKVDHARQLKTLISEYLVNMHIASQQIVKQDDTPFAGKVDQALHLQKQISEEIVRMHCETQNIIKQLLYKCNENYYGFGK
ncbi:hypothetical protein L1987_36941 [Smallanthus sonchifolius]|uniref:Uncharacterized protein n=1 Tax=Smallanthus sonchifolius TaxID=185202 RepID=A0ACB9HFF8_9ASTR|nr:hypothetical protein L1987_36941 [Smallanthus sonchifolius]